MERIGERSLCVKCNNICNVEPRSRAWLIILQPTCVLVLHQQAAGHNLSRAEREVSKTKHALRTVGVDQHRIEHMSYVTCVDVELGLQQRFSGCVKRGRQTNKCSAGIRR